MAELLLKFDPSRYPLGYLLGGPSEDDVQAAILEALWLKGVKAWAIDAGGKGVRRRLHHAGYRVDGVGKLGDAPKGWPDIVGHHKGRALYIEVKRPAQIDLDGRKLRKEGRPTPEQIDFLRAALADDCAAGVAWSVDDALRIVGVL